MKKLIFVGFLIMAVSLWTAPAKAQQGTPMAPTAAWQFQQPLPLLSIGTPVGTGIYTTTGNTPLTIRMCEFWANILPSGAIVANQQTKTRVWGYIVGNSCPANAADSPALDTYIGPVIVNNRGSSTPITFVNDLGTAASTQVLAWKYSTDQTLHWADPLNNEGNVCAKTAGFPAYGTDCAQNYNGPIPAVVHLHGGEVPPNLDGGPDAWFMSLPSTGAMHGHGYYSFDNNPSGNYAIYKYPNTQEAAPIWFHDHVLGITRLNVYAGLAGAYFIQDPALNLPLNLQGLTEVIPIVIQDRMFDTNGQLFFPADSAGTVLWATNPEHPYWVPEFIGDTIVVNGKAWPYLDVEAKRYRFLFLNGSNARTYELNIPGGPKMYVIGTDGGYLDAPVPINKLVIMPGERYEVIIDFAGVGGSNLKVKNVVMTNAARTPYPRGISPRGTLVEQVMQFRVTPVAKNFVDPSYNPALGTPLRTGAQTIVRLPGTPGGDAIVTTPGTTQNVQLTRQLTLNEVMALPSNVTDPVTGALTAYPGGPLMVLVNNTMYDGERITGITAGKWTKEAIPNFTAITVGANTTHYSEVPQEGDTEVWEIVNISADAHPIHLHLVQFQIINRENFSAAGYTKAYNAAFPAGYDFVQQATVGPGVFLPGYGPPLPYNTPNAAGAIGGNPDVTPYLSLAPVPPLPEEAGWKDTVVAYPGQVTRLAVRWAPTDLAVQTTGNLSSLYFPFDPSNGIGEGHGYVWHCHIIDHEDNEMMRPTKVLLNPAPAAPAPGLRPLQQGTHY